MKALVLCNPSSRGGRARRLAAEYARLFPEGEFVTLGGIGEATERAADASGVDAVVACGGDGTVRAVAEGLLRRADAPPLGVFYAGTSPDFCRFHGIPTRPEEAVALLRGGKARGIPVLTVNGAACLCSCNIGLGAAVASRANRWRPWLGDTLGPLAALLATLARPPQTALRVDGAEPRGCAHLVFTRMPFLASGLKVALPPLAEDEFAQISFPPRGFFGWLRLLPRLYQGLPVGEVAVRKAPALVEGEAALEYDGDPHGSLPAEIRLAARKLAIIAP